MAYNNAIPQATDNLSTSQPEILANFAAIATAFNLNHTPFNSSSPAEGTHMFVEMPNQNATPPTTIANEVGLYCNTSAYTTQPELFFIKQNGTTAPAPLNGANGYEITASNYTSPGWTRLASGILLKWGIFSTVSGTPYLFDTAATIPIFQQIYNIQLTCNSTLIQAFQVTALTTTSFTPNSTSTPCKGYYFALGV